MRKHFLSIVINSILLGISLLIFSLLFVDFSVEKAMADEPATCHAQAWDCGDWWPWTNGVQCMIVEGTITCSPCGQQTGCGDD